MRYHRIADETIRRLPIYLRGLVFWLEQGKDNISSQNLADLLGIASWQIRKDFSYFGGFGVPGVGYNVKNVITQIKKILKIEAGHKVALVGVGNLGSAVLAYPGFRLYGFDIVAAFDVDPKKVGKEINKVRIEDVSAVSSLKRRKISIAIISVPGEVAQQTADALVKAGIKAILNFSPCYIAVPKKVKVITVDIAMELARLPYYMPAG